jgi:peroxiredoxin
MNLIRIFAVIFLIAAVSCNTKPSFEINGTVTGVKTGKVYFQKFHNKYFTTIDSANIQDGKFHLAGSPELPELYGLTIDTTRYPLFVFLKAGEKLTIDLDTSDASKSKIGGSVDNELFTQYKLADKDISIDSFIREHPKSLVALYILYRDYSYRLSYEEIEKNIALLDTSLIRTQYVDMLKDLVGKLKNVQVGKKAPDFTLQDTSGREVTLSSHFGKYLLLDFWASWCGPCRRENPNIVKAYQKFHDKGFDIVGVSLDKRKENWIKGIETDHLTWTHVSDLAYWNSKVANLYGVRAIPSNLLIDPSGVIVARNIFDEELDHKLDSLLNKK